MCRSTFADIDFGNVGTVPEAGVAALGRATGEGLVCANAAAGRVRAGTLRTVRMAAMRNMREGSCRDLSMMTLRKRSGCGPTRQ